MKSASTKGSGGNGHVQTYATTFAKVVDGRKQPIRGLWIRSERFYAQLTILNPVNREMRVRRAPLVDKDGSPVTTTAQNGTVRGEAGR